jgi:small-conductance mechanosensitive channel
LPGQFQQPKPRFPRQPQSTPSPKQVFFEDEEVIFVEQIERPNQGAVESKRHTCQLNFNPELFFKQKMSNMAAQQQAINSALHERLIVQEREISGERDRNRKLEEQLRNHELKIQNKPNVVQPNDNLR